MRKLGRRAPTAAAAAAPRLHDFARAPLPLPPSSVDYCTGVKWRMFCNNWLGCCTISGWANGVLQRTSLGLRTPLVMDDATVQRIYSAVSGWSPANPELDPGALETDVLTYFARTGVDLGRQAPEVTLWGAIDPVDHIALRQAVWLFGHSYIGIALPLSARDQVLWDVPAAGAAGDGAPGSWGGHCAIVAGYDVDGVSIITWGAEQRATWAFLATYMDEAYVTHAPEEWISVSGLSPSHFDWAALADAQARLVA